jgi:hypothetical protein
MAAGPLSRVVLAAASVADDLNYVALADISRVLDAQTTDYRIIGGLMVTALAVRWELGASLYRETLDADLGVPPIIARDLDISGKLKAGGYQQVAGDRFERPVPDIPAGISGSVSPAYRAVVDVLVPAYTSRPRQNVRVGTDLVTTEVPGLHMALARAPVELALDLRRLNSDMLSVKLLFPDEASALTPQGLRNQRPDEAHGHHRRLALPRDLLRSRSQSRGIQPRSHGPGRSDHTRAIRPPRRPRHAGADRSATPEQGRRRPAIHPDPGPDNTPAAANLSAQIDRISS